MRNSSPAKRLVRSLVDEASGPAGLMDALERAVVAGDRSLEREALSALRGHGYRVTIDPAARRSLRAVALSDHPEPAAGKGGADGR